MEQVAEHTEGTKIDWRNIRIYDDDGSQIRNPRTLRAIAEGQEILAEWLKRKEKWKIDDEEEIIS